MKPTTGFPYLTLAALQPLAAALTIAEINGNRFLSPYAEQVVTNVTGLVLARGRDGIWLRSTSPDDDLATSESIFVFGNAIVGSNVTVGDIIALDAKVTEWRPTPAASPNYQFLTELTTPANVRVLSSAHTVVPLIIGQDTPSPPTSEYSSLDGGDVFALPNNEALVSVANPILNPTKYGLDFWESLSGELVTVRNPTVLMAPASSNGFTWVVGDWAVTGRNAHGGLTMSAQDGNPEAILIADPLDGSDNPLTSKMGDRTADITGIVKPIYISRESNSYYSIVPTTALQVIAPSSAQAPPASLRPGSDCRAVTVGSYNVENLSPASTHLPKVAAHIVDMLGSPDLLFVQEIQDDSGPTDNDGILAADRTLSALAAAVEGHSNGTVRYHFASVEPAAPNTDGGANGANIRQAYLYRPERLELFRPSPGAGADGTEVLEDPLRLRLNPGRIEPGDAAWTKSRKPLAAAWMARGAKNPFFTVNVHWASKTGGASLHANGRTPVNAGAQQRLQQAEVTGAFIKKMLAVNPDAAVIAAGDFNEFAFVEPMQRFASVSGLVDLDDAADVPVEERYSYVFGMNAQALDHMYVSPVLARGNTTRYEHIHANTWAAHADVVSDHDPSVALFNLC